MFTIELRASIIFPAKRRISAAQHLGSEAEDFKVEANLKLTASVSKANTERKVNRRSRDKARPLSSNSRII